MLAIIRRAISRLAGPKCPSLPFHGQDLDHDVIWGTTPIHRDVRNRAASSMMVMDVEPMADYLASLDACRICGKHASDGHTAETRAIHSDHMARHGWSGMCVSPVETHYV